MSIRFYQILICFFPLLQVSPFYPILDNAIKVESRILQTWQNFGHFWQLNVKFCLNFLYKFCQTGTLSATFELSSKSCYNYCG